MVSARGNFWIQVTDSDSDSTTSARPCHRQGEGDGREHQRALLSIPPIPTAIKCQSRLCEGTALPAALLPLPNPILFPG